MVTILCGGLQALVPRLSLFRYLAAIAMIVGLVMVIVAASYVLRDNRLIQEALRAKYPICRSSRPSVERRSRHRKSDAPPYFRFMDRESASG